MRAKKKGYSLQRRILLFYLVPLFALLAVLFLYVSAYRVNVETLAETTFQNLAQTKRQKLEENLNKIMSVTKEVAYSAQLQQYLVEMDASEKIKTYQHLQNYLRVVSASSEAIESVYASLIDGSGVHMGDGYYFLFEEAKSALEKNENLSRNQYYLTELDLYRTDVAKHQYGMCFYVGSTIYAGSAFKNLDVISGVMYDPSKLIYVPEEEKENILVLTIGDTPVFLSGEMDPEKLDNIRSTEDVGVKIGDREYYQYKMQAEAMPEIGLLYLVPRELLINPSNVWEERTTLFTILSALLLSLSVTLIINSVFLPIRQVSREVENLHHYGEMISTPRARELAALTDTFNSMSLRISSDIRQEKKMVDRQYQLEIQKNRMEMQAFRNQINPHFLFNTLECINAMVRYYDLAPVSKLITNLSGCFRYSLYSPMLVKLSEEIGHLNNYMDIIETRFPGKYRVIQKVHPLSQNVLVPSLLLQPLAENAVTHAFAGNTKKARPTVVLQAAPDEKGEYLYIHITDNGIGMTDEKLKEVSETMKSAGYIDKHISLNNVCRRLTLLYGEDAMKISTRSGCYTKISVRIPIKQDLKTAPFGDTPLA